MNKVVQKVACQMVFQQYPNNLVKIKTLFNKTLKLRITLINRNNIYHQELNKSKLNLFMKRNNI